MPGEVVDAARDVEPDDRVLWAMGFCRGLGRKLRSVGQGADRREQDEQSEQGNGKQAHGIPSGSVDRS